MNFQFIPPGASGDDIQLLRKKSECLMFDIKKIKSDGSFLIIDESFDFKLQPLRLAVTKLNDIDRSWKILNDAYRRNTMIIAGDSDVRSNPEIIRFLESQGVALLMVADTGDGFLSLESLTKSLTSLKFKSILVEDRIDLIKEFTS